jgi:undecaprenyl-diphosphatase
MSEAPQMTKAGGKTGWLRRSFGRTEAAIRHLLEPPRRRVALPSSGFMIVAAVSFVVLMLLMMVLIDVPAIVAARTLPAFLRQLFGTITDFGKSGWFLFPLGIGLIVMALLPPDLPRRVQLTLAAISVRAGFLFLAIGVPGLFTGVVKRIIGRARPFVGGAPDAFLYHPFAWSPAYASMPSGHTTTAFAAAVAIGALWPRARTAMWIYAGVILISRVVVTAHHPSDVFAGAVVGTVGALMVRAYFAARGLAFGVTPEGVIRPFPGPSRRRIKAVARALLAE